MQALIHDFELSYKGRKIHFADGDAPLSPLQLEGVWYISRAELVGSRLAQWRLRPSSDTSPRVYWRFSRVPFRENMGRRERLHGWLGCSYDVDETACGKVRVRVPVEGRLSIRAIE